ncbi:MAG: T9SS type A sorting domain-containing protein, partial [Fidelibacterota bacterium]
TPFYNTDVPLNWREDYYHYANAVWIIFLHDNYGTSFDSQIWEVLSDVGEDPNLISVTDNMLDSLYDSNLSDVLEKYSVARYFTGARADSNNYFMDWLSRDSKIFSTHRDSITVSSDSTKLYELGGTHYIEYIPGNSGFVKVNFDGEDNQGGTNYSWRANLFIIPDTTDYSVNDVTPFNLDSNNSGNETVYLPASGKLVLAPVLCEWEQTYLNTDILHLSYEYSITYPSLNNITFKNEFNTINIGDSLSVAGLSSSISNYSCKLLSGSSLQLPAGKQFRVETNIETTQLSQSDTTLQHHRWGSDASEFRLIHDFTVPAFPIEKTAKFVVLDSVIIISDYEAEIQIRDPWFVENDEQNNEFHTLTDTTYILFLDQDPEDYEQFYVLRTTESIGNGAYSFDKWQAYGSNGVVDTTGGWAVLSTPNNPDSCMVIFLQEHAIIRALYTDVPPTAPDNFAIDCSEDFPILSWSPNVESDLSHYRVYYRYCCHPRWTEWFYFSVFDTVWTDNNFDLGNGSDKVQFKISALDVNTNESGTTAIEQCANGDVGTWPARETDKIKELPDTFSLQAPYPNPFNPTVRITVALPEFTENASLIVFDITGRQVDILVSGPLDAGYHNYLWDGSQLPGGLYILKYSAHVYTETRKMILLK